VSGNGLQPPRTGTRVRIVDGASAGCAEVRPVLAPMTAAK
jgi:hypothetical protein